MEAAAEAEIQTPADQSEFADAIKALEDLDLGDGEEATGDTDQPGEATAGE